MRSDRSSGSFFHFLGLYIRPRLFCVQLLLAFMGVDGVVLFLNSRSVVIWVWSLGPEPLMVSCDLVYLH